MRRLFSGLLGALLITPPAISAAPLDQVAVTGFIDEMVSRHTFERAGLEQLFAGAERSDRIIELMSRPAEKVKPWHEYRPIFISTKRIRDGVAFWNENREALARATAEYGVDSEVIVAIIGVETAYGRISGGHSVLEALATLAFHYPGDRPKRAAFFRAQLEHMLLLAREDGLDAMDLEGSYAGAMGIPQFMPENYRKLAVDFDQDGERDIWSNPTDAIGSVANYLAHHGWRPGGPIFARALVAGSTAAFLNDSMSPQFTLAEFVAAGITPDRRDAESVEPAALFELEGESGPEYWIGYTNFYVISRYNPRVKYTMAVAQLARAIRDASGASNH